jgi:chemosensory pili system protein ChpA (sensor histidine kinase/response regulator)
MEELYRRVSDRQTMGSVVDELRSTLGEVETALDAVLPQSRGPCAAARGPQASWRRCAACSRCWAGPGRSGRTAHARQRRAFSGRRQRAAARHGEVFEKLGNSLGAMGFLIDMLSYQRALAKKLFVYDEERANSAGHGARQKAVW